MNTDLTDNIYQYLKSYLEANSSYSPRVLRKALKESDKFPLVTLTEENNAFSTGTLKYKAREIVDSIYWEINIYATDTVVDGVSISNSQICNELASLVDDVMTTRFRTSRLSCKPTPNLDETIYRITMRYYANVFVNRKRII